jgi:hydrogenase maturation factor
VSASDADRELRPVCHDGVCITCSDTAVEVTVVELLDLGFAVVDTGSGREEVSVALVSAGVGDRILVHAGEAIARLENPSQGS